MIKYFSREMKNQNTNIRVNAKKTISLMAFFLFGFSLFGQRKMEVLNRSSVAIKIPDAVYVNWRLMGEELHNVSFNVYRDGAKLNNEAIKGATNFVDSAGTLSSTYTIGTVVDGIEVSVSEEKPVWNDQYIDIPVREIDGGFSTYSINDGSIGDLDGDGEYEIVVKRLALDMTRESTAFHFLEAYELDGTFLWAINMGPNIYNDKELNFLVYDFDEDGKAEIVTRTSEGTIDGLGNIIPDQDGDGVTNYRYSITEKATGYGFRSEGPDFISVFEGETGKEIARDTYIEREPISQWGLPGHDIGQLAHRATKCMWTVAYLDGKHPSIINSRGIYERIKLEAWDFDGLDLTKRWSFDSDPGGIPTAYHGQGNHNLSLADVDQDGKDEIVYASMVIDNNGEGLYSTGLGHGDALHVMDMDPDRDGLEIWACLEQEPAWGSTYRDAATGEVLLHYYLGRDMGRCAAGDITSAHKGAEMWGGKAKVFWNAKGENIGDSPLNVNFMIWWDGDLLREFCDHNWQGEEIGTGIGEIRKYNGTPEGQLLLNASGTYSNNHSKGTPVLQADILGDWREEVIWRSTDNSFMRLYATTTPTGYRIPTLMHDPQYRIAVAWQNNSYNQPPHVGFYLAAEMDGIIPYPISNNKTIWNSGDTWDLNTSYNWVDDDGNNIPFNNGDDVLFDLTGDNSNLISIDSDLAPRTLTYTSPKDFSITGPGSLTSDMALFKAGTGRLSLNNKNSYSGETQVLYGELVLNDTLENSQVTIGMFGSLFASSFIGNGVVVNTDADLYIGRDNRLPDEVIIGNKLELNSSSTSYFYLSDDTTGITKVNSHVKVEGDLSIKGKINFNIDVLDDTLSWGIYELIKFTGSFSGNIDSITINGIRGVPFKLGLTDSSLFIEILEPRENTSIKWKGGQKNNIWDLALTKNWDNNGNPDWFLRFDSLIFDNTGANNNIITLENGDLEPSSIYVNSSFNYTFNGNGYITGPTGINKTGTGTLVINALHEYTGPNKINGGTITIASLGMAGEKGYLGASNNNAPGIQLDGGTIKITAKTSTSDRDILIGPKGGEIYINNSSIMHLHGSVSGLGKLTKNGYGKLNIISGNTNSGGLHLVNGTIHLASEDGITHATGDGPFTIESGTVSMVSNNELSLAPWNIIVPNGANATLKLKETCQLTGNLTGNGKLNIFTPGKSAELLGDWSQFEGTVNASADASGWLLLANKKGYGKATINLDSTVVALYRHTSDDTIEIGALTGITGSRLGAGGEGKSNITWKIGGSNKSFKFFGAITEIQVSEIGATTSIIKTGSGEMTLGNESYYTGSTLVKQGRLLINNTAGSGTGTGKVIVLEGATIGGKGSIDGTLEIGSNGTVSPGEAGIGTFTVNNNILLNEGSYYLVDLDNGTLSSDVLISKDTIELNGILYLAITGDEELKKSDSIKILEASIIEGNFTSVLPEAPSANLAWDLSTINTDGYLRIKDKNHTLTQSEKRFTDLFDISPNPNSGKFKVTLNSPSENLQIQVQSINGKTVYKKEYYKIESSERIDLKGIKKGIYLVNVIKDGNKMVKKIIIQ